MPFSFEIFPPRNNDAQVALNETIRRLAETNPEFISVTYGASGSSRDASFDTLRYVHNHTDVTALAHLTTIGQNEHHLTALINEWMDAGINDFLALRGDPPVGQVEADIDTSNLLPSAELVRLIVKQREARGVKGRIAVAAYPNGHPRSVNRERDIAMLVEKQDAGADFAITQLFFEADEYLGFVADAREAGLTIPVLPGLMPVSTAKQLRRIAELAGHEPPADLLRRLEQAGDTVAPEIGVEFVVSLARELLAGGAPSLHLYTFNRHESVIAVLQLLRMI